MSGSHPVNQPATIRPGFAFSTSIRVRYSEIDGQMVVFNSRYLEYATVASRDFWVWAEARTRLPNWRDVELIIRRATVDYHRSFRLDDLIQAWVRVERLGESSLTLRFELTHSETGELHAVVEKVIVHIDRATRRPVPIAGALRDFLEPLARR